MNNNIKYLFINLSFLEKIINNFFLNFSIKKKRKDGDLKK